MKCYNYFVFNQVVSIRWYLWGARGKLTSNVTNTNCDLSHEKKTGSWTMGWVLLLHSTQAGVLWRYFKLFIPVDLTYVKHEVRSLILSLNCNNLLQLFSQLLNHITGERTVCSAFDTCILRSSSNAIAAALLTIDRSRKRN